MAQEVNQIVRRVFQDIARLGHVDLEASEMAIRASSHRMGGSFLEKLLNWDGGGYRGAGTACAKGHRERSLSSIGTSNFSRPCWPLGSSEPTTTVWSAKIG